MPNFEIQKTNVGLEYKSILLVDEMEVDHEHYFIHEDSEGLYLRIVDSDLYDRILQFEFPELKDQVQHLNLQFPFVFDEDTPEIQLGSIAFKKCMDEKVVVRFHFEVNTGEWRKPWSIKEYQDEFKRVIEEYSYYPIKFEPVDDGEDENWGEFSIIYEEHSPELLISEDIDSAMEPIDELHRKVVLALYHKRNDGSIVIPFAFPDEVKVPCEQYLLYFVEFLKDVGINASAGIQESPGKVLFSVTPSESSEALEKIQMALDIYLQLPQSPISSHELDVKTDFQTQRLVSNIQHLQGQLALAGAIIQQKDFLINQQAVLIGQQSFSSAVLLKSMQNEESDREEILGGLVSVKGYDIGFAEINVHTIVRKLKEYFRDWKK